MQLVVEELINLILGQIDTELAAGNREWGIVWWNLMCRLDA